MATEKQKETARENIKKAQERWSSMSSSERSRSQPEGRERGKPGETGGGEYFRIVIRPKEEFETFRYHDVGEPGHIQRLAGKRTSGSWDDQAWLISKQDAHIESGKLVADTGEARDILDTYGPVRHIEGDIFEGHPRRNVPESAKPTPAQQKARRENIRKAQAARHR